MQTMKIFNIRIMNIYSCSVKFFHKFVLIDRHAAEIIGSLPNIHPNFMVEGGHQKFAFNIFNIGIWPSF